MFQPIIGSERVLFARVFNHQLDIWITNRIHIISKFLRIAATKMINQQFGIRMNNISIGYNLTSIWCFDRKGNNFMASLWYFSVIFFILSFGWFFFWQYIFSDYSLRRSIKRKTCENKSQHGCLESDMSHLTDELNEHIISAIFFSSFSLKTLTILNLVKSNEKLWEMDDKLSLYYENSTINSTSNELYLPK
jgi:hypothetical protein